MNSNNKLETRNILGCIEVCNALIKKCIIHRTFKMFKLEQWFGMSSGARQNLSGS